MEDNAIVERPDVSKANKERIDEIALKEGWQVSLVNLGDATALVVVDKDTSIDVPELKKYGEEQKRIASDRVGNRCYFLSATAVHDGVASGVIHTYSGVWYLSGGNHAIAYDELGGGKVIGFDVTAGFF